MDFILVLVMVGGALWFLWLRNVIKKRKGTTLSSGAREFLHDEIRFYRDLDQDGRMRFEKKVAGFLNHIKISGVDTSVTEEDRLLVASSAVIPIFAFPDWEYTNLNEVLLYPNSFSEEFNTIGEDRHVAGMVGWGPMNRTMILSRQSLRQGFENEHSKSNVGIHEFVHLIDKLDGATDGLPEVLLQRQYSIPWMKLIRKEMEEIRKRKSNINPYGATNEAEFFSVASEYFFTQPDMLKRREPELYEMLEEVFRQDPARRTR